MRKIPLLFKGFPHFLFTFFVVVISAELGAQPDVDPKPEADDFYGKGGKKVTKTVIYLDGSQEETVRFFDPEGRERQYKQTIKAKDGSTSEEHITYDCNGKKTDSELIKKDGNGKERYYRAEKYDVNGKDNNLVSGYLEEKDENGESEYSIYDPKTEKYERMSPKPDPAPKRPLLEQDRSTCPGEENKIEISGGYSHLLANFEPENEGLSGWAASAFYNLNPRWSVGLFSSGHYKSPENQKFSMYFFHGALKYNFGGNDREKKRFNPYVSLGLGISTFKSEVNVPGFPKFESDDQSFCPMIGAGIDFEVLKKLYLNADASYVPTHFQDKTQHNFRLSTGIAIGLFRARRDFPIGD